MASGRPKRSVNTYPQTLRHNADPVLGDFRIWRCVRPLTQTCALVQETGLDDRCVNGLDRMRFKPDDRRARTANSSVRTDVFVAVLNSSSPPLRQFDANTTV